MPRLQELATANPNGEAAAEEAALPDAVLEPEQQEGAHCLPGLPLFMSAGSGHRRFIRTLRPIAGSSFKVSRPPAHGAVLITEGLLFCWLCSMLFYVGQQLAQALRTRAQARRRVLPPAQGAREMQLCTLGALCTRHMQLLSTSKHGIYVSGSPPFHCNGASVPFYGLESFTVATAR